MFKLAGLFFSVLLMLQSRCCANSDEIQDDDESEVVARSHEVVDSFPRSYNAAQYYPWRLWNFPYYQPRTPQIPFGDGEMRSPPLADPRFVTNRCNPIQSYTYYTSTCACYTTYITSFYTVTTTTTVTTNNTIADAIASRIVETPSQNNSDDYDAATDYISDISPTTPLPEFA